MSLWFLLWFLLSAILIGATVWSTLILIGQKKAWAQYAKQKGLKFTPGTFLGPASMEGEVDGYLLSFFTAERQDPDARKRRLVTVLEMQCPFGVIDGAAAGTSEMLPFMQSLTLLKSYKPEVGTWNPANRIFVSDKDSMDKYLTALRVDTMNNILSMKNADILIMFDVRQALVRIETSDPLQEPIKIEKTVAKLKDGLAKLELSAEEKASFKTEAQ